jgi:23S rRNA U2552 (ribose-2'-O)-methylase RlmE/FtsJ
MTCQQNPHCFDTFYQLIKDKKPNRILEIGTSLGGFTQYLKHVCDELGLNTNIRSYDIYDKQEYDKMIKNGIDVRVENIFSQDYNELIDNEVDKFIKSEGVTIVLCDGGNKVKEFKILSEYLKRGDIIMAHDYARDSEFFKNEINKVYWNWHEISESHIQECIDKHNLKPYMQNEFDRAVWVCKIKE